MLNAYLSVIMSSGHCLIMSGGYSSTFRADSITTVSNKTKNVEIRRLLCHLNTTSEQIDVEQGFNLRKQVCPTSDSWYSVRKSHQSYFPWQLDVGTANTPAIPQCFVFVEGGVCCLKVLLYDRRIWIGGYELDIIVGIASKPELIKITNLW